MTLQALADVLNSIRRDYPSVPVLCIPWLHLKHPIHPVQLSLLTPAVEKRPTEAASWQARLAGWIAGSDSWFLRSVFVLTNALRLSLKLALLRWSLRHRVRALREMSFKIVAKTWAFGPKASARDFYYGDLQDRLAARGVSMLLLCGNAANTPWLEFGKGHTTDGPNSRLSEMALVSPLEPLRVAVTQIGSSLSMRFDTLNTEGLRRKALERASLDCLDPAVTQDSLLYHAARSAVRAWRPQAFLTLYEGHGWEKAAWWGAKTALEECRTVGYQHTVIFPEALSLLQPFVDVPSRSEPDVVMALGDHTARLLAAGASSGAKVISFGSFRRAGEAAVAPANPAVRNILVLPEGIATETEMLFRFACDCAKSMPSHQFILRAHPQWPMEKALAAMGGLIQSLPNVEISPNSSIDEDFRRSSAMLYRGSSSVFYGILNGLFVVNLQLPGVINSDPVYELTSWRKTCRTVPELKALLDEHENAMPEKRHSEWRAAADYVSRYIVPVNDRSIDSLCAAIESRQRGLCTA